jgi:hypothetical protein
MSYKLSYHQISNGYEFVVVSPQRETVIGIRSFSENSDLSEALKAFDEIQNVLAAIDKIFPVWIDFKSNELYMFHTQETCGYIGGRPKKRIKADSLVAERLNLIACEDCYSS